MRRIMSLILSIAIATLATSISLADQHGDAGAEVRDAVEAFSAAYRDGEIKKYFDYYADDAIVYFYGARQDLAAYREEWQAMVDAGGEVEKNELSDVNVQVLPGGAAVVATYFVDYRLRTPDGNTSASRAYESEVWQQIDGDWKIVNLHYSEIPEED